MVRCRANGSVPCPPSRWCVIPPVPVSHRASAEHLFCSAIEHRQITPGIACPTRGELGGGTIAGPGEVGPAIPRTFGYELRRF